MRAILLAAVVLVVGLAGCADDGPDPAPAQPDGSDPFAVGDGETVRDLRTDLTAEDAAPPPAWKVGDWFGHHLFFGAEDSEGSHINTVVVDDLGSEWLLATDDPQVAKWEAAWDFPMLGSIGKADLAATAFSADWGIYRFPMTDGMTWTSSIDPLFNGPRDVAFTAEYDPSIGTPYGVRPGFVITGTNGDGQTEILTDYVPEIGWYSELWLFDTSTEDPEDFIIHILAMGRGEDWTGTYYIDEADVLVNWGAVVTPFDATGSSPPYHQSFTLTDAAHELYGIVGGVAAAGVSEILLVDPDAQHHEYQVQHVGDPNTGSEFLFEFVELAPVPGQWEFAWGGAGAGVAVGFANLFEIQEHAFVL